MRNLILLLSFLFFTTGLSAQGDSFRKHAVLLYPTRVMNYYFPALSVGYHYRTETNWSGGIALGVLPNIRNGRQTDLSDLRGFDIAMEGRYQLGGEVSRPWGVFVGLEASRAYTTRPYGLANTEDDGVAKVVDTRVVARRNELNLGLSKSWTFKPGFVFDIRIGGGLNSYSWKVADNRILTAPRVSSIFEDDGHYGFRSTQANQQQFYFAPRIRMGLGWAF